MHANFFDTNVLVYLALDRGSKTDRAQELVGEGGVVSVQVLNEIANVARRKRARSWDEVRSLLATLRSLLLVEPLTPATHETGLFLAERHGFAVYDGMIVAAALIAGCHTLWSEDMQDGLTVDGRLTIRNPFRA